MAERKLSDAQRRKIRKDLKRRLRRNGKAPSEVFMEVGKKYGIRPESVRWYYKSMGNGVSKRKSASGKRSRRKKKGARGAGRRSAGIRQGVSVREVVENLPTQALQRALEAKALLPQLNTLRRKEAGLQGRYRRIGQELNVVSRKATRLERRIKRLCR